MHFCVNSIIIKKKGKCKAIRGQPLTVPGVRGSQISRQSAHEGGKVVSLMHQPPLPPGNIPGTHFCYRLSRPQGRSAAGRIMAMKNSNNTIRNRTRDLPACSPVSQPIAPPRAPSIQERLQKLDKKGRLTVQHCRQIKKY